MSIRVAVSRWGFLEVDIRVRLPDGTRHRERVKSPVQSRSGAKRWGEECERFLAINGATHKKAVPTLEDFEQLCISQHIEANRLKPSTAASYKSRLALHIRPALGRLRLDEIDKQADSGSRPPCRNSTRRLSTTRSAFSLACSPAPRNGASSTRRRGSRSSRHSSRRWSSSTS